ncbi:IS4 family transposase [Rosistilla oblonga]|uniref:Transposase for transposon Tn5 n=1 Tax=Rosistilla oblonga TaxID=2527990 RepID=A0A518IY05_9BACT|nr:IS4 family transposase [Rosistilla oblonga]QDV57968.1 Transposase for transposon Tn5 [Rosistilla oblonga]QDV58561.1 Transposase for transposon Tn5 [Rosistilla oblonga]
MQPTSIAYEFQDIQLGDKRLNDRAEALLASLAANPSASINEACSGWDETKAAYRLFDNPNVDPEAILGAHAEKTLQRIKAQDTVCIAQDTTELDYTAHPPEGVRNLDRLGRRGLYDHSHIAFTPEKLCLGVVGVKFYDRDKEALGTSKKREGLPLHTGEGQRWLDGYRKACEIAGKCPETQIVSLADREGDIYDIFVEADQHETPAQFVIRSQRKRSLPEKDPDGGPAAYKKMRAEIASAQPVAYREVQLPQTPERTKGSGNKQHPGREARTAKLEIRAKRMTLRAPHNKQSSMPPVEISVVWVSEIDGPGDGTEVDWLLLSSLPVDTIAQTLRIVDLYVARWPIEVFFRVFKTGCRVEEIQLEARDRLIRALMFYKVIAWRIMFVTFLGRECPELPCDVVFSEAEWKSVWKVVEKTAPPKQAPELSQFIPVLATLGGYNHREGDGPPGAEVIWRGTRRMLDFALCWQAFGPDQ